MANTDPTWYLGRAGELLALPDPEQGGVDRTRTRIVSNTQGINGSTTMNLTGIKRAWSLTLEHLPASLLSLLNALNSGVVAGPLRLIDPLTINMLPARVASTYSAAGTDAPFTIVSGTSTTMGAEAADTTFPVVPRQRTVAKFVNSSGGTTQIAGTTWQAVRTVAHSLGVWVKTTTACTVFLYARDAAGTITTLGSVAVSTTGSWVQAKVENQTPGGTIVELRMGVSVPAGATVRLAAAQLEQGTTATAWNPGDDVPVVDVVAIPETSPFYPYTNATLQLVEL